MPAPAPRYEPTPRVDTGGRASGGGSVDVGGSYGRGATNPGRDGGRSVEPSPAPDTGRGRGASAGGLTAGVDERGSPRFLPPDTSGRASGRTAGRANGATEAPTGPSAGRTGSGRVVGGDVGNSDAGRVWRETPRSDDPLDGLVIERREPRAPIPVPSGSTPGIDRSGTRDGRARLSERTGRIPGEGPLPGRTRADAKPAEGLTRVPAPEVTRESILRRYEARPPADTNARGAVESPGRAGRTDGSEDLSRARLGHGRTQPEGATDVVAAGGRVLSPTRDEGPQLRRGSEEARRRDEDSADRIETLRRVDPDAARHVEDRGRDAGRVANDATNLSVGVAVGAVTGIHSDWFWEPTCSPHGDASHHGKADWDRYWNTSWWWGWNWGFAWYGSNWSFAWNWPYGYCHRPWWAYSYYQPSSWYWTPSPFCYTSVIYVDEPAPQTTVVVYQDPDVEPAAAPAVAGEGVIAEPAGRVVEGGAPPSAAPEVKRALVRGAVQYLELGDEAFGQGRYGDAVHHYARAVEYAPDDGVLYLILSDALFATGDYHYAAFALRRALELEPTLLENVVDKHGFYGDAREFDRQIVLAEDFLDEHFLDDDARLVLAANYLFANRPAQCVDLMMSAFSRGVVDTQAGKLILERARELRAAKPGSAESAEAATEK